MSLGGELMEEAVCFKNRVSHGDERGRVETEVCDGVSERCKVLGN